MAALLRRYDVDGIELAPTSIWGNWSSSFAADANLLPVCLRAFARPAMQSLTFGLPDHKLFAGAEAEERLLVHLGRVFALAARLGCRALVFGSPGNRRRGALTPIQAAAVYGAFAARVAPMAASYGVLFCLEANPSAYGCDFVTGTDELLDLYIVLRQHGLGLHFDTGTAAINGEDLPALIRRAGHLLDHLHISEPKIRTFSDPVKHHREIAEALASIHYRHWVSIEMLRGPNGLADIDEALRVVRHAYSPFLGPG